MELQKWGELKTEDKKTLYIAFFPLRRHGFSLPLQSSFKSVEEAIAFLKAMLELFDGSSSIDEKMGCKINLTKEQINERYNYYLEILNDIAHVYKIDVSGK